MNEVYFDPILGKPRDKDPQVIQSGGISGGSSSSSSAAPLITKDEGSTLTSTTASLNFVGSGVTATNSGNDVTITVPGGGSGGSVAWGDITGTLSNQTDLQSSLDAKQPLDSDLTTIAGLTATTNNFIVSVASAWASRTPSQVRTTLGLVIGTDVQAWDADLDTWATKTAPSGAVLGDTDIQTLTNKDLTSGTNTFPTFNQNTTGSAAKWTTARNLAGNSVDGSGNVAFANKFVVQGTSDSGLSAAQFLGALGTGIVKNTTTTGVLSIAVAGDFPTLNQNTTGSAATLTTPRTIGGVSFDGSANITVASATGGFTISGGDLALGTNNITMTGSLGATGARLTKGWFTDLQVTNAIAGSITGNAATVTTNANLTGPITSSGNATSVASQTGTGSKFVMDTSPTIVTPTIASFTNAQHNHSNAAGGGTFAHANLTSLTADDHTQYALLAGRSGGQTLIGGTASGNSLTLQSTSNSTKGDILTVQQAGERFIVNGTSPPTANSYTKFAVAHANTYSAGETVIANDMRSLPTFDTTTNWSFTGVDMTTIAAASQATTGSVIGVSFQAAAGNSGNTANVIGVNAYATGASGAGTIAKAISARIGHGGLAGTVTDQYGILFSFQGFAGAVTNGYGIAIPAGTLGGSTLKVGIDVGQETSATTNIGIRNAGATVYTPLVKTITAAGNSISVASTHAVTAVRLDNTSGGAITLTSTPTITAGQAGQILYIYNGSAQNVVFQRESALAGSKLRLGAATRTLNQYDTLTLMYDAQNGYWVELSFVDNT